MIEFYSFRSSMMVVFRKKSLCLLLQSKIIISFTCRFTGMDSYFWLCSSRQKSLLLFLGKSQKKPLIKLAQVGCWQFSQNIGSFIFRIRKMNYNLIQVLAMPGGSSDDEKSNGVSDLILEEEERMVLKKKSYSNQKRAIQGHSSGKKCKMVGWTFIIILSVFLGCLLNDIVEMRKFNLKLTSLLVEQPSNVQFSSQKNESPPQELQLFTESFLNATNTTEASRIQKTLSNATVFTEQAEEIFVPFTDFQKFTIPKLVWVYVQNPSKETLFVQRCMANMKWFANKSTFNLTLINSSNYQEHIPADRAAKVKAVINDLEEKRKGAPKSGTLFKMFDQIKEELIMMEVIRENGGILVKKNIIFTEDFKWIEDINSNIHVNKGRADAKTEYFGFHQINFGSLAKKEQKSTKYEVEKYMIKLPGIDFFFLAGIAKGRFIIQTIDWYHKILMNPHKCSEFLRPYNKETGMIIGREPYNEALVAASLVVLHSKQAELNNVQDPNSKEGLFAIDYYGVKTMNSRYFPKKIGFTFQNVFEERIYRNLAKYSLKQLQETVGPLRYMVSMMMQDHMEYRLIRVTRGESYYNMHPQSFYAKYFFMDKDYDFLWKNIEKPIVNTTAKPWTNLPKIIWLFWDKGIEKSTLANKLCVENIKFYGEAAGYEIRMLNNSNIESYIGSETIERIDHIADNRKIETFAPLKSNFYRIALVSKYGGVYMDVSYFAVETFEWLTNISQYPSEFIFNRFGQLPKIFMIFHPHYGQPFQWVHNEEANTKQMWLAAYENNLIIAEPNQILFEDWFNEYEKFITTPYETTEILMKEFNVFDVRWTSKKDTYLAAMESLKNTQGRKQKEIRESRNRTGPKSPAEYYGVWSMSGYRGQQKFRPHTNFDRINFINPYSSNNLFLYRNSKAYVDGIVGKVNQFGKLYSWSIKHLNDYIKLNVDSQFRHEAHPDSYFMRYLYDTSRLKIVREGGQLVIVK